MVRLHVNIDHVATVRQARRARRPDPVEWAVLAERAGADGITAHLRKDRRHIQDADLKRLRKALTTLLNLESSLDPEMIAIALESRARCICLVPENRQEVTTEGGLDVVGERRRIARALPRFARKKQIVSLFIDPDLEQVRASADLGAPFVELHTGCYANANGRAKRAELARLERAAVLGSERGLRINAGHGLDYGNVGAVARLPRIEELNIGHAIVAHALFVGIDRAIGEMRERIGGRP